MTKIWKREGQMVCVVFDVHLTYVSARADQLSPSPLAAFFTAKLSYCALGQVLQSPVEHFSQEERSSLGFGLGFVAILASFFDFEMISIGREKRLEVEKLHPLT